MKSRACFSTSRAHRARTRRTLPAKRRPGMASRVMRASMPTRTPGASISSMGALTYMQESSIRSMAGGVGMPGGEGVANSPSSPVTSATMPAKGARQHAMVERRRGGGNACPRLAHPGTRRDAVGAPHLGVGRSPGLAFPPIRSRAPSAGGCARPPDPPRRRRAGIAQPRLGLGQLLASQFSCASRSSLRSSSSTCPAATRCPLAHRQGHDCLPAGRRRQPRPAAGLDGPGAGVGNRRLHAAAAAHRPQRHRHRGGPQEYAAPPAAAAARTAPASRRGYCI